MGLTMEKTSVTIIGAGPAGLALALSLAKYEVHVRCFLFEYIHVLTVLMMGSQSSLKRSKASPRTQEEYILLEMP